MIWRLAKGRSVRTDWWNGNVTVFDRFWDQSERSSLRDSQIVPHSRIFLLKIFRNVNQVNIYFRKHLLTLTIIPRISSSSFAREKIQTFTSNPRILGGERCNTQRRSRWIRYSIDSNESRRSTEFLKIFSIPLEYFSAENADACDFSQ